MASHCCALKEKINRAVTHDAPGWTRLVGKSEPSIEQRVYSKSRKLLRYFVPDEHDRNSLLIQLFWGTVHELMVRGVIDSQRTATHMQAGKASAVSVQDS